MITKFGKRFLTSYLSGSNSFASKEIALGIGSITPNVKGNDTRLNFEFYRLPVELSSFNILETGVDADGDPIYNYFVQLKRKTYLRVSLVAILKKVLEKTLLEKNLKT
jgi:hypothetical protein